MGCTVQEYRNNLESQFKPEMTWENHGKIWEIDHIIPLSLFNLTKEEEQKRGFHHSNTQPLFKTTKIAKSFTRGVEFIPLETGLATPNLPDRTKNSGHLIFGIKKNSYTV